MGSASGVYTKIGGSSFSGMGTRDISGGSTGDTGTWYVAWTTNGFTGQGWTAGGISFEYMAEYTPEQITTALQADNGKLGGFIAAYYDLIGKPECGYISS